MDIEGQEYSGKTQLHVFHDKICLSVNQGYDFKLLKECPIHSITRVLTTQNGVTLTMRSGILNLRTEQGSDIKLKLAKRLQFLSPARQQCSDGLFSAAGVTQCDRNSNIVSSTRRKSKSCQLLLQESNIVNLVSKADSLPLTKHTSAFSQRHLSSLSHIPYSSNESACKEEYGDVNSTPLDVQHFSDPCLPLTKHTSAFSQRHLSSLSHIPYSSNESACKEKYGDVNSTPLDVQHFSDPSLVRNSERHMPCHDNEVNFQRLVELQAGETFDHEYEIKSGSEQAEDESEPLPPPIPLRQLKPNLGANTEVNENTKEKFDSAKTQSVSCKTVAGKCNPGEITTIPRTRSFQIVEQPLYSKKRQRYKSDSSIVRKTITELVQPICVDPLSANNNDEVEDLEPSNSDCLTRHEDCILTENKDGHNEKSAMTSEEQQNCSNDKIHYVNLPAGSRPSCYLYMNLPDLRNAPKEAVSYVNHVFMSRSMKGIYENVFGNNAVPTEEVEPVPSLPPPILLPRQPPPRIPERVSSGKKQSLKQPPRLPKTGPPPPPRPPKKCAVMVPKVRRKCRHFISFFYICFSSGLLFYL